MLECAGQCLNMEKSCSLSSVSTITCGEGRSGVRLRDCRVGIHISVHLGSCHLSKSGLTEFELILARAGIFDISPDQLETMTVCANHREKLGKLWRPLRSCQYPTHAGPTRNYKTRSVFNVQLSREVLALHGKLVQIGFRKYSKQFPSLRMFFPFFSEK